MSDYKKDESSTISGKFAKGVIAFEHLASKNEEMQNCLELAIAASQTTAAVLIVGEGGTGKKLMAQAIHNASSRSDAPYITLNCASTPENLIESELFGIDPSASKGIDKPRRGKFEIANGGTLVLDKIGELTIPIQARLVRALEYGQFERVGGEETLRADVRLVALAGQSLSTLVSEGRFREDLYYRLNEVAINLPPLRQRREDLRSLIFNMIEECNTKFAKHVKGVSQIALDYLMRYDYPGNIRELKSLIKRAVTVAKGELLWLEDLGMRVEVPTELEAGGDPEENMTLALMEKRHIQQVIDHTKGNKKRASEILQISRPTLDRKIKIYSLRVP